MLEEKWVPLRKYLSSWIKWQAGYINWLHKNVKERYKYHNESSDHALYKTEKELRVFLMDTKIRKYKLGGLLASPQDWPGLASGISSSHPCLLLHIPGANPSRGLAPR